MDAAFISAFFGLGGAIVGGLTSFLTTWLTQRNQINDRRRETVRATRYELFRSFIAEASRLYGDALSHEKDDVADLVQLYALIAHLRLLSSPIVVTAAEKVLDAIIEAYLAPNRTLQEIRSLARVGDMNFLLDFSRACRTELGLDSLR